MLENELLAQQKRIDELETQVGNLNNNLQRLAMISKVDEKYPYWHTLVQYQFSELQRLDLEFVLSIMSDRLSGIKIVVNSSDEQDDIPLGVDSEDRIISFQKALKYPKVLFNNELPTLEEVQGIYKQLGICNEHRTTVILKAMYDQGLYKKIIKQLLSIAD
ncbi:hypothetical protein [Paenibacillus sp. YPG26]|uniref:hypothetical protein n=1 Tax=Paenibacillus sp. YPG26 TaxID=2878915 RepID=UPI002041E82E|nr:hypothetical protein [Paenibacillus sp. YPG26]USB34352.1 hypothetical protein LDO05_06125 [Paenibacillus sp. YPG26]